MRNNVVIRASVAIAHGCVNVRIRIAHRNILSASAPPPSHSSGSEDGDECNEPGTALEPPNKCPRSHARPIRLGLNISIHGYNIVDLSTVLSQYESIVFKHHKLIMCMCRQVLVHNVHVLCTCTCISAFMINMCEVKEPYAF